MESIVPTAMRAAKTAVTDSLTENGTVTDFVLNPWSADSWDTTAGGFAALISNFTSDL